VEAGKLLIRTDRNIHEDVGIKDALLAMLFSYNIQWLVLGLETVFDAVIVEDTHEKTIRTGNAIREEAKKVRRFLYEKWLMDADTEKEYRKYVSVCQDVRQSEEQREKKTFAAEKMICTYHAGYKEALDRHALKKFLQVCTCERICV